MSKTRKILESTYEGFKMIAQKKYDELKSKLKTGDIDDLGIDNVLEFSQKARNNKNNKARRYTRDGVKNFLNNKKVNGRSSGTNFSYKTLLFNNISGQDLNNKKFIRGNMDSATSKSYRRGIDSPTLITKTAKYKASNPSVGVKSSVVTGRQVTSTSTATTTSVSSYSGGSGSSGGSSSSGGGSGY
jgi:hypothetical protein